ncbi:ABC transporter ATP-binding protein [Novosphingobium sp. H3SJ31-1]|uniref:ABC transporter ATP-binding protein n=2 Tax=Novosphingobium album (ex Liu et al. 2023) TaxID=3031130 RepID=A0ABT5WNB0_9SPHN|nr:ABC transporter ATP-binding protein [Novosphingobium album (ex Liu et al. 2023)]
MPAQATARPSVIIDDVSQVYPTRNGDYLALDRVSLTIAQGEFVSLLGPSGCGKSTLLKAVSGLTRHTSGRIEIGGHPVVKPQTDIGIVFQEPFLLEWRSVLRNVMLQAEFRKLDKAVYTEKARDLLERVGLGGFLDSLPHELSGGMRQRAAICRAMLHDPSLLLMDEPFGALDAMTRDNLNLLLQDIWLRSPKTVLFVTHGVTEAILLSDRVVVMSPRPGRIAEVITIDLPRPRTLKLRATPEFGRYAHQIHEVFRSLGVDS